MAIDTIKASAILDGAVDTADLADGAITSAKLDTNINLDGNLGVGTTATEKLDIVVNQTSGSRIHTDLGGTNNKFVSLNIDSKESFDDSRATIYFNHDGTQGASIGTSYRTGTGITDGLVVRTHENSPIIFSTNNSEVARFEPSGLSFDSGTNHLDDYEEGTWTPIIVSVGGTPTTNSFGVNGNYGYYTKVGNIVTAHAHCIFQRGTATGSIDLGGLPFTSANVSTGYASTSVSFWNIATSIVKLEMHLPPNATQGANTTRILTSASTSVSTALQSGNINTGDNTILYSITYRTA